ncbi:hypothetical protein H4Q26_015586 [Puccinia striiformis f. sp. tritici PST-130]|nr:hypothetical protein H4Q26_015586 [Puccinia striiformis f. sp. tritici PST-130]
MKTLLIASPGSLPIKLSKTNDLELCLITFRVEQNCVSFNVKAFSFSVHPYNSVSIQSAIQVLDIHILMLRFLRLTALVLLVASWQVTDTLNQDPGDILFWCRKNVDAVCAETILPDGGEQNVSEYSSSYLHNWYKDISNGPNYFMKIASGPVPYCDPNGQ